MSLRQGVVLWCSGSLTTFIIVGVFWTIFRNELDAARSLVAKANATFEQVTQVNQLVEDVQNTTQQLQSAIVRELPNIIRGDIGNLQSFVIKADAMSEYTHEGLQKVAHQLDSLVEQSQAEAELAKFLGPAIQKLTHHIDGLVEQSQAESKFLEDAMQKLAHYLDGLVEQSKAEAKFREETTEQLRSIQDQIMQM